MSATENEVLLHALDHAYDATSWHGPNLRGAIRGLSHVDAAWRPRKGRNSVWELVVHCAYWKYTVRRRMTGEKRGSFPLEGSNFFRREAKDGAARWKADVALLDDIHRSLRAAVEEFPERRWSERVKGSRWTYRDIVAGAAAHDLYHAGQMRLLKVLGRL
jgi:hypothetical protein